jgi:hypothetical protein
MIYYNITKFWDNEFKHLNYITEPFNDDANTQRWIDLGFPGKFTGDMADMRGQQPSWNDLFIKYFEKEGWSDVCTSYYRMMPGTILPTHSDLYLKYIDLFDLKGQEKNIKRAVVFLEDWVPGHYAEYINSPFTNWSAGATVEWSYDESHMAANMGLVPRYTLQITGHVDD